jgi:hypothetical protein
MLWCYTSIRVFLYEGLKEDKHLRDWMGDDINIAYLKVGPFNPDCFVFPRTDKECKG